MGEREVENKELVEPIDEYWKKELLESLFGSEDITMLSLEFHDDDTETEYEIECVLRRVKVKGPTE